MKILRFLLQFLATVMILVTAALQGCGYGPADYENTPPSFTLSVGAETLSMVQGTTTHTSVKITRTAGPAAAITFAIQGAPAGILAEVTPTAVADSMVLQVTAAPTMAPGVYSLFVVASGYGATPREAAVAIVVNPFQAEVPPTVETVFAGEHSCALKSDGAAFCWGYNGNGQLGNGTISDGSTTPVAVTGGLTFGTLSVARLSGVSCGLTFNGAAWCWGDNTLGQLGDGSTTQRSVPTRVAGGHAFLTIAASNSHVCGLATDGVVWCWGSSNNGALGDGDVTQHLNPAPVATGLRFRSIVVGDDYSCALTDVGAAFCWGLGTQGQLGNGAAASSSTPVGVAGGHFFFSIVAGGRSVCGLTFDRKAFCWGNNFFGTLGTGSIGTEGGPSREVVPVAVAGGRTFRSITAGYLTMCGVTLTNEGYCWGYNFGAVGDGSTEHRGAPTLVSGGLVFQSISAGTGYSCGITADSKLYCWGENQNGALGDGTKQVRLTPTVVQLP